MLEEGEDFAFGSKFAEMRPNLLALLSGIVRTAKSEISEIGGHHFWSFQLFIFRDAKRTVALAQRLVDLVVEP